jgi:cephalosporin-C deacetylase-like acetyl esterase
VLFRIATVVFSLLSPTLLPAAEHHAGPWEVDRLLETPVTAEWGEADGLVRPVFYDSEPFKGKPTRVFAYYAKPAGDGPFPAMLLVHGGGGKAFAEWAKLWADRGYVALAMDTSGNGPDGKRLPDGGPDQSDETKFRKFGSDEARQMWTYHAVAAVLRGHALLAGLPEVDPQRIGITGISWGGYLTCIVAGIDHRLKVAVPVYGCGFLDHNSVWQEHGRLKDMPDDERRQWVELFDPSRYLTGVQCPIFFVNGTNDFAYPLDSYQKSYNLVKSPRTLRITVNMPHGHPQGWAPQEIGAYVDSVLKDGPALLPSPAIEVAEKAVSATVADDAKIAVAEFHYTTDGGRWQNRKWKTVPAKIEAGKITATLPTAEPLVGFFTLKDARGMVVSSDFAEFKQ